MSYNPAYPGAGGGYPPGQMPPPYPGAGGGSAPYPGAGGGSAPWPGAPPQGGAPWPGAPPSGPPQGSWNPTPPGQSGGSMAPVYNPPLPYVGQLSQLYDGFMIKIQGTIPQNANRFHINMSCGPQLNEKCDNALHLNPRFEGTNQVVRNSFLNNRWDQEERGGPPFPFQPGNPFECIILVTNSEFRIAINGQHFCEYRHRTAKERVTHLVIEGNVQIQAITQMGAGAGGAPQPPGGCCQPPGGPMQPSWPQQPPQWGSGPSAPPGGGYVPPGQQPPSNLSVPHKAMISGGLHQGRLIHISGIPKQHNPDRFAINLKVNDQPNGDVALHFNPRFQEKVVVRNSFQGGWKNEERQQPSFPFVPGTPFEMIILVEQHELKVAVNNQHFIEFRHRIQNLASINMLEICGDLQLTSVRV